MCLGPKTWSHNSWIQPVSTHCSTLVPYKLKFVSQQTNKNPSVNQRGILKWSWMSATKTTTLNLLPLLCSVCMHQTVYEESVGVTSEIVTTSLSLSLLFSYIIVYGLHGWAYPWGPSFLLDTCCSAKTVIFFNRFTRCFRSKQNMLILRNSCLSLFFVQKHRLHQFPACPFERKCFWRRVTDTVCLAVCVCRLWTRWCFCFLRPLLIRVIMRFTGPTHAACLLEVRRRDIYLEKWQHDKQTRAPCLPFNLYKPQHSLTQTLRYDQRVWYTTFMYVCVLALSTVWKKLFREAVLLFWWLIQNLKNFLQGGDVDFNWHE